jgi:hypothetical protein
MAERVFNYDFDWDHDKARKNFRKHRVTFKGAATIFLDKNALSVYDDEHDEAEERWITIGMDSTGNLLVVCHTFNQLDSKTFHIRVISARKPTKKEIKQYEEIL